MTDERVLYLLRNFGIHEDAFPRDVCEQVYKIGIAFAKRVEEETMLRSKAKWYMWGAEDERKACAEIVDAETEENAWESSPSVALNNVAAEIRARGK